MKKRNVITCCPHCGSTEGIYMKCDYIGVKYCIGFDHEEQNNSEMYDNCGTFRGGKVAYCQTCGKPICRMSTLEKQWAEAQADRERKDRGEEA